MTPRVTASRRMLVFVVVIVARAAMTDGTLAPPGDQRITTSRDGCRIQPADDGVGVHVDCAGLRLGHIPGDLPTDMTRLKMRRNNITRLDGNPFERYTKLTSLDLSRNDLETVGSNVFADVLRLEELELTYNQLCMNKNTFHVGLFSGMASLRRLTLTSNACKTQHTAYPDEALAKLTNLQFLSLTGIPTSRLGEGFGRLTNLKTLVFAGHGCKMPVLTNKTFEILRNVRLSHLSLKTCRLKTLEAGALEPLSHLKTLNLACNHDVDFINIYTAIITAKNMKLKTLVVDDVTPTTLLLDDEQFAHNAFTDVERMSLRANYIMQVDVRKLRPLKKLTHFNLGYNVIGSILPDVNSSAALFTILFGLNLDVVDVSDIFTNVTTYRHRYCFREAKSEEEDPTDPTEYFFREPPPFDDLNYSRVRPSTKPSAGNMTSDKEHERLTIPPSVQVVYADHILPPLRSRRETAKMNVSADNNVVVLNVSYNPFTAIGPIRGLHRLQMVDFRHCAIETISPGALSDLRMLKYLYLMNNRIGTKGTNLKGAFDGLSSLEVLDLSGNAISQIHVSAFSGLTSLRILSLRENQLTSVSFDISGLLHLATINLADNSITRIYPNTMDFIKRRHIHVIMYGNPIATTRQSRKNLVIVVCVLCAVALVVGLAVAVFVVRRQRSRNCLGNATRRDGEDDDLLRPDELLDDIIPDLPAGVPDPLELGEQMPGEMQLQVQQPGQCEET